ncbi:MAG: 50S ribosomal protein L18e [Candidatus Bathyarchaeota archaeon]|nr:50S ribosomal protein L18e [Candidatus Bathyarchaeota archaeon]
MRQTKSTNPEILQLISFLKKQSREKDAAVWLDVAEKLAKPSRQRIAVNLSRINRYTETNETVVVPGKILASGTLDHAVTVAAFDVSDKAKAKLTAAKAKYLSITELVETNPKGSNIRIIG